MDNERQKALAEKLVDLDLGKPLFVLREVGSTSDVLKERAVEGLPHGATVLADSQTAGRGRMGRKWLSAPGKGVYTSVLLKPEMDASESMMIGMITALAVCDMLTAAGIEDVRIKWPNDVLVSGRKIAGVLVEPRIGGTKIDFVVVGVGINVSYSKEELADVWQGEATSMSIEGVQIDCNGVFVGFLTAVSRWYGMLARGETDLLYEKWREVVFS